MEKSYELALTLQFSVKVLVRKAMKPKFHSKEDCTFFGLSKYDALDIFYIYDSFDVINASYKYNH